MSNIDNHHRNYTAAILIIGNEILSGRTQDTNTSYIAKKLNDYGIQLQEVRIIPDVSETIVDFVNALRGQFDYLFTTGGIGPTHDDITSENIAKALGVTYERNEEANQILLDYYGQKDYTKPRQKMAMIPKGASLIPNPVSAAPGFQIENVIVMAGVPKIMQAMIDHIAPTLKGGQPVLSKSLVYELPESHVAKEVGDVQDQFPDVEIGSYPQYRNGVFGLNLVLRSKNEDILSQATDAMIDAIRVHGKEPSAIT